MPTRRDFLKACSAAGVFLPASGLGSLAFAAGPAPRPLPAPPPFTLFVFQRGGADGLSLVGPSNDPHYIEARAPGLRVQDSGKQAGLPLANGLAPDLDFRFHSGAAPLHALYQSGELALLHACGLLNGTRSHFEAADLIERGANVSEKNSMPRSGWLTRYLATLGAEAPGRLTALSANAGLPSSLALLDTAMAIPSLEGGLPLPGGADAARVLEGLYRVGSNPAQRAGAHTLALTRLVETHLPPGPDGKFAPYVPGGGASYQKNAFTAGLQAVARLVRMDLGLQVACIDHLGWDTHGAQENRLTPLLGNFARDLTTFHQDMLSTGVPFRIVVMTEFGRRLRSNRSFGTDHGHGALMMVIGHQVNGGRMFGSWPGLDTEHLDRGLDLAVTTDYRAVLAELLSLDPLQRQSVFPGLTEQRPLGLLKT